MSSKNSAASRGSELQEENSKVMYEESILMTLLGPDYNQFISEETGEWIHEEMVIQKFQELFETRIRCIFDAVDDDGGVEWTYLLPHKIYTNHYVNFFKFVKSTKIETTISLDLT